MCIVKCSIKKPNPAHVPTTPRLLDSSQRNWGGFPPVGSSCQKPAEQRSSISCASEDGRGPDSATCTSLEGLRSVIARRYKPTARCHEWAADSVTVLQSVTPDIKRSRSIRRGGDTSSPVSLRQ